MTTTENLWPDFALDTEIRGPKTILTEQASFLANGTRNLLTADVIVAPYGNDGGLSYRFEIIASNLNGYKYTLFRIFQGDIFYYPCNFSMGSKSFTVNSEGELLQTLKGVFSDAETTKIITSLIAQSKENATSNFV